jgi:hypothetical protein
MTRHAILRDDDARDEAELRGVEHRAAPDVPVPPGAEADEWQNDAVPNRVLWGEWRGIDGVDPDRISVAPSAIQLSDGRIDDGSVYEPPHVHLLDDCLTPKQARELAARLIAAADEVDGWLDAIARCPMCDADGWLWGAGEDGDPIRCDHQAD